MTHESGTVWKFGGGKFALPAEPRSHLMLATAVCERPDLFATGMLLASEVAARGRPVLLGEPPQEQRRLPGLFSSALSRGLAEIVAARFKGAQPMPRGSVCHLVLPPDAESISERLHQLSSALPDSAVCIATLPAPLFREVVDLEGAAVDSVVLLADLPSDRSSVALVCGELGRREIRCRVWQRSLTGLGKQRAMIGLGCGGKTGSAAGKLIDRLLAER